MISNLFRSNQKSAKAFGPWPILRVFRHGDSSGTTWKEWREDFVREWKAANEGVYVGGPTRIENLLILQFIIIRVLSRYEIYDNFYVFTLASMGGVYAFGNYSYRALFLELIPNSRKYWNERIAPRQASRSLASSTLFSFAAATYAFKSGKPILGACLSCLGIIDYCDYRFQAIYGYTISSELRRYATGMQTWDQTKTHVWKAAQYADSPDIPVVQDARRDLALAQQENLALREAIKSKLTEEEIQKILGKSRKA